MNATLTPEKAAADIERLRDRDGREISEFQSKLNVQIGGREPDHSQFKFTGDLASAEHQLVRGEKVRVLLLTEDGEQIQTAELTCVAVGMEDLAGGVGGSVRVHKLKAL